MTRIDAQQIPPLRVVGAFIQRDGKFLVARRPAHKASANLWELPGGKVHENESDEVALMRELREELDVQANVHCRRFDGIFDRDFGPLQLLIYDCTLAPGAQPRPLEHSDLRWISNCHEIPHAQWCSADFEILSTILSKAETPP